MTWESVAQTCITAVVISVCLFGGMAFLFWVIGRIEE